LGRPVLNKTNLTGRYELTLQWTPDPGFGRGLEPNPDAASAEPGPTLFTALQEQLGLRVESQKQPGEVYIIDHLDRHTAN
jgi:uncharacterized protein (TIGR03435 family)